jgi:putative spermidine/putrescine transport system ATP-binding protein/putrescine transport system ATP-binding protein
MSILELTDIVKRFGPVLALDGISFSVEPGQIVSLLGPSGCGKTTTLRMVAGFEHPDAGSLKIGGIEMRGHRPYERNVGLLFQDYALFPHMTVEENISYGPRIRRTKADDVKQRVASLIQLMRLAGLEQRRPSELSGGQQQRVALARALATNPQLLLLDEPLSALDAKLRQELQIELKELLAKIGTTTIIVTHDQEEAMALSERVIVMNRGRIIQDGSPIEIYRQPRTRFVAQFIGRSNLFSGERGAPLAPDLLAFRTAGGQDLAIPAGSGRSGAFDVCVRPEHVMLTPGEALPQAASPGTTVLRGTIATTIQLGASTHHVVEIEPQGRVLAIRHDRSGHGLESGDRVWVTIDSRDCILIHPGDAGPAAENADDART